MNLSRKLKPGVYVGDSEVCIPVEFGHRVDSEGNEENDFVRLTKEAEKMFLVREGKVFLRPSQLSLSDRRAIFEAGHELAEKENAENDIL